MQEIDLAPALEFAQARFAHDALLGGAGEAHGPGLGVVDVYDPNGAFASLKVGATATDTFTYRASDGTQTSNPAIVTDLYKAFTESKRLAIEDLRVNLNTLGSSALSA